MSEFNRAGLVSRFVAAAIGCSASVVWAQEPTQAVTARVTVAAQPLAAALQRFSEQSGLQVGFESQIAKDLQSKGTDGAQPPAQALAQLLDGTGLDYRFVNDRTVVIRQSRADGTPDSGRKGADATDAAALDKAGVALMRIAQADTAAPAAASQESLDEVVVSGKVFNDNLVESAYKLPLSVKEIPQSVKVITPDMMEFARVERFEDLYKVDAGAFPSHLIDGFSRTYFRGFMADSDNAYKLDGMRAFGVLDLSMATLDRLEIIKGSTSTMYGRAIIGGGANAISKKPTAKFGFDSYVEGGTYDHKQAGFDIRGGLTDDDRLSGRLVVDYLDEGSHIDYFYNERLVVGPSLRYEFTPDTTVTVFGNFQDDSFLPMGNFGVRVNGPFANPENYSVPDVPRSRLVNQPDGYRDSQLYYGRVLLESRFTDSWQLRVSGQHAKLDNKTNSAQGVVTYEDDTTDMETFGGEDATKISSLEANVFGDVTLFNRTHTLFVGADYYKSDYRGVSAYASLPAYLTGFSIYNPDYSLIPKAFRDFTDYTLDNPALANVSDYAEANKGVSGSKETGVTAQFIAHPTDRWTVLLGGRYSDYEGGRAFSPIDGPYPTAEFDSQDAVTWQTGTTYAITPQINVYASFGETFTPRFEYSYDAENPNPGNPVGPERGEAYELGIKSARADGKFSWSAALFDIARTNITQRDLDHLEGYWLVVLGKQRSRGLELDAQGEVLPGWSVYGSLAFMDNKFVEGEFRDYPAFFAPKTGLSAYTSYVIQAGSAKGLGFGGGVVYKQMPVIKSFFGSVQGKALDLFDDVLEIDARVFYDKGPWGLSLAVTNLADQKYYSTSYPSPFYAINVNPGRQLIGRVSYSF